MSNWWPIKGKCHNNEGNTRRHLISENQLFHAHLHCSKSKSSATEFTNVPLNAIENCKVDYKPISVPAVQCGWLLTVFECLRLTFSHERQSSAAKVSIFDAKDELVTDIRMKTEVLIAFGDIETEHVV